MLTMLTMSDQCFSKHPWISRKAQVEAGLQDTRVPTSLHKGHRAGELLEECLHIGHTSSPLDFYGFSNGHWTPLVFLICFFTMKMEGSCKVPFQVWDVHFGHFGSPG